MPTPFYHLALAQDLLADPGVNSRARQLLDDELPAFLFGNTAPDVQSVSGRPREATHFFHVPPREAQPPHLAMFAAYPGLSRAAELPAARAAFLAGYICHLLLDLMWIQSVYLPAFGPAANWGNFRERLFLHNVLRAHLDQRDRPRLPEQICRALGAAAPNNWLPFESDGALARWRDVLTEQLAPGGSARTAEIFAARARLDVHAFEAVLNSPQELERRVFSHIPLRRLDEFRAEALVASRRLLGEYLG